jgi:hypothetical protein
MQGEYPANGGFRLRRVYDDGQAEPVSARLFLCGRCRCQVIICRRCDRGQVYCAGACSGQARRQSLREAGRRYERTLSGRQNRAERSRRHRARQQEIVTHHGSASPPAGDLLPGGTAAIPCDDASPVEPARPAMPQCHWCGDPCLPQLRQGFLRRRERRRRRPGNIRTERNAPW